MRIDKSSAATPPLSAEQLIQLVKVAAVEETGNRAVFNRRHDPYILKWIKNLGVDTVIQTIKDTDFTQMDYFYSEEDGEICMWEKLFLDRQLSNYEELRSTEYQEVHPFFIVEEKKKSWNPVLELAIIQDEWGPRHPKAREFARKWNISLEQGE